MSDQNSVNETRPSYPNYPNGPHPATQSNTPTNFTQSPAHEVSDPPPAATGDGMPLHQDLPPVAHAIIALRKNFPPLSEQQLSAIELLVLGHTDTYVSKKIRAHRTTVTKWRLYNPHFRAALSRRRQEIWGTSADRFRKTLSRAITLLQNQLNSFDDKTSHRAARTILSLAASKNLAPPDDPQDPAGIIHQIARQKKIEWESPDDPRLAEITEHDLLRAMQHLDEQSRNFPLSPDPAAPPLSRDPKGSA